MDADIRDLPIYILLHGVYGSAWAWALKGGAHLTAQKLMASGIIKPAIVAMPSDGLWGDGSGYLAHHEKAFDHWVVSDVPLAIKENISQATDSSKSCIGGLSMGGYGALMLGARYPEKFSAISSHSAITCLDQMRLFVEEPIEEYQNKGEWVDVLRAMENNRHKLPALRFDCGVDDELIGPNRKLHQELSDLNITHLYEEFPGGHDWSYWKEHVARTFQFFDAMI